MYEYIELPDCDAPGAPVFTFPGKLRLVARRCLLCCDQPPTCLASRGALCSARSLRSTSVRRVLRPATLARCQRRSQRSGCSSSFTLRHRSTTSASPSPCRAPPGPAFCRRRERHRHSLAGRPPLAVNTRGTPSPLETNATPRLIAASRQSLAAPIVFTTPQTTSALRPSSAGLNPLHLWRAARLAGLHLGGVDREIREAHPHSRTPGFHEVASDGGTVTLGQHNLTDATDRTRRKPCFIILPKS